MVKTLHVKLTKQWICLICLSVCLQDEKSSLQQIVQSLQTQLDQTKAQLHQTKTQYNKTTAHLNQTRIQLDQFTADLLDLQEVLSGPEDLDEDKHRYQYRSRWKRRMQEVGFKTKILQ